MEERVIHRAMQILEEKTGLKTRWYANAKDKTFDGTLEIKGERKKYKLPAIFKRDIKNIHLVQFQEIKDLADDFIIIAEVIYPGIRERLRGMGMNYFDMAGNCYIKKEEWIFLIEGFKNEQRLELKKEVTFTKTSLLLLFHFLNDEDYLNATYRQMAEDYGIALGNITKILKAFKAQGYLLQYDKKTLRLKNKKQLLDQWVNAYEFKLKPTLEIGRFRFTTGLDKEWKKIPIKIEETQWGAEPAAELLTGYLKPGILTFYTASLKGDLIKHYRLAPDPKGNLFVYKKFWKFHNPAEETVPPILVYADLINTGDPRNIETARKIYDGLLKDQF